MSHVVTSTSDVAVNVIALHVAQNAAVERIARLAHGLSKLVAVNYQGVSKGDLKSIVRSLELALPGLESAADVAELAADLVGPIEESSVKLSDVLPTITARGSA